VRNIITPSWSVTAFQLFWAHPRPHLVPAVLTSDVVGYWPGRDEPVHGRQDYTWCISSIVEALPDIRLTVAEYATHRQYRFVRWVMHATGELGPFEVTGIDRLRLRGGLVAENFVVFDTATFEKRAGIPVPWRG